MSMLSPKRTKFRKSHKGHMAGNAKGGNVVSFGDYGMQVVSPGWLTARQLEAARVAISRHVKKTGKMYMRVFPDHPFTKKPAETRMGTGKGGVEGWVAVVKPGRVLFEVEGVPYEVAKVAFERAHHKLTIKTKLISREPVL
jgi:large subunit ribosomal protein L16